MAVRLLYITPSIEANVIAGTQIYIYIYIYMLKQN